MMEDALIRLNLSIKALKDLALDGVTNMSGAFKGAHAIMRAKQPCALFVHYGAQSPFDTKGQL